MAQIEMTTGTVIVDVTEDDIYHLGWISEAFKQRPVGSQKRLVLDLVQIPGRLDPDNMGFIATCAVRCQEKDWDLVVRASNTIISQLRSRQLHKLPGTTLTEGCAPASV